MRRIVCVAAALFPYYLSSLVTAQVIAGVEIATSAAAGSADDDAVPAPYRVVAPSTVCATPTLLQQYAFKEDFPPEIPCERIDVEVLLRWSGAREAVLVDELLAVARVETKQGLRYILAGSLAPVEKSETAANAPSADAAAGSEPTRVSVTPGKEVRLRLFSDLTSDCSPGAAPELRLTVGPQHGSTSVRPVASRVPKTAKCGTRTIPGSALFYTPEQGFSGQDSISLLVITESDGKQFAKMDITVDPSPPRPRR